MAKFLEGALKDVKEWKLVSYERQVVCGWNHKLTYEGKNGKKRTVVVYESPESKFELRGDSETAEKK